MRVSVVVSQCRKTYGCPTAGVQAFAGWHAASFVGAVQHRLYQTSVVLHCPVKACSCQTSCFSVWVCARGALGHGCVHWLLDSLALNHIHLPQSHHLRQLFKIEYVHRGEENLYTYTNRHTHTHACTHICTWLSHRDAHKQSLVTLSCKLI